MGFFSNLFRKKGDEVITRGNVVKLVEDIGGENDNGSETDHEKYDPKDAEVK